ncbi:MAG: DeoR/GlpR family DNA-binding transcription regulator [Eubacteriales bacterium]|nr:DeoR/GlpR family DNA-binding transcription regulator [Eubacteriales bacterium]
MIPYQRRMEMLQLLEQQEIVSLSDFCEHISNVSESTIRRDLKTLEAEGEIILLRGGGACLKQGSYEVPVQSKTVKNVNEKEKIAKYAASLVHDGESIYIDSGSTLLRMAKYLKGKDITLVTTNALFFSEIQGMNLKCFIIGGEINFSTASIVGTKTNSMLAEMYFDKAFLGANGFSDKAGISTPDIREAEKKQIVNRHSNKTYVLADSSKSGRNTLCKVFDLGEVTIICDKMTDMLEKSENYLIAE